MDVVQHGRFFDDMWKIFQEENTKLYCFCTKSYIIIVSIFCFQGVVLGLFILKLERMENIEPLQVLYVGRPQLNPTSINCQEPRASPAAEELRAARAVLSGAERWCSRARLTEWG